MKIFFIIILVLLQVFLVVLAISSPVFVDRQSAAHAYLKWHENQTPENEVAWLQEKVAIDHEIIAIKVGVVILLVINQIGITVLVRRILRLPRS